MPDLHKPHEVTVWDDVVHLTFREYSYEGPRTLTVRLSIPDALRTLDELAEELGQVTAPSGSIILEPCDGDCDWCGDDCTNKTPRPNLRLVKPQTVWSHGPDYIAPMKLDLGNDHPHQQPGS